MSPEPEVFDVTESAPEPVTLLLCNTTLGSNASPDSFEFNPRYGSSPNCMVTARKDQDCQKHYHCPNCWSCTCDRKPRLRRHYDKCLTTHPTQDTSNSAKVHANVSVKPKLQSAIVDSKQGIYIVRTRSVEQGTGKPIHEKAQSQTNIFQQCDCSGSGCAHATIAMLVTDETIIRGNRIIENRKKNTSERLSSVKKTLDYIIFKATS